MDVNEFTKKVELFIDMWKHGLITYDEYIDNLKQLITAVEHHHSQQST